MDIILALLTFYKFVVFASVVISWVNVPQDNPIVRGIHTLTEPPLKFIRQLLPSLGGMDFSPMILLLGIHVVQRALIG